MKLPRLYFALFSCKQKQVRSKMCNTLLPEIKIIVRLAGQFELHRFSSPDINIPAHEIYMKEAHYQKYWRDMVSF
jgi:hypothetical protein